MSKKLREVTVQDIIDYNLDVGECYFDQNESVLSDRILLGFIIAKRPEISFKLLKHLNSNNMWGFGDIIEFFNEYNEYKETKYNGILYDVGYIEFTELFVQFVNLTEGSRLRVLESFDGGGSYD